MLQTAQLVYQWLALHLDDIYKVAAILTFVVIVWYTIETSGLRKQMVRQNRISLRPIVLPRFEVQPVNVRTFRLHNLGGGCAKNVRVTPIPLPTDATFGAGCKIRFGCPYYMASGENLIIPYTMYCNDMALTESTSMDSWFFPRGHNKNEIKFSIQFEDIEGHKYEVPVTVLPKDVLPIIGDIREIS